MGSRPRDPERTGIRNAEATSIVYLVDDEARVRSSLARLLRSYGFQVESFGTAEAFLSGARPAVVPCCLVVDLGLPGLSGLDLQDLLAEHGLEMAVVFISGRGDVERSVQAMKGGAVDFLEKPFSEEVLLQAVQRGLEQDRRRREASGERAQLQARYATLSPREREVFDLVVMGLLNKQAAAELGILEGTIKVHRARVMQKMGAESLPDLVRMSEKMARPRRPVPSAS